MSQLLDKRWYWGIFLYTLFFIGVLVWGILLQYFARTDTIWNYAYNIGSGLVYVMGGFMALVYSLRRQVELSEKRGIMLLIIAQFLWGMGSFVWAYFNFAYSIEVPFPSLADVLYVGFSVYMAIALWFLLTGKGFVISKNNMIHSFVIIVLLYSLTFYMFWIMPVSSNVSFIDVLSNFMYPVLETFIITLSFIALCVSKTELKKSLLLMLIGMIIQLIGDYMFGYSQMLGLYWNGGMTDIMFVISGYILSVAIASLAIDSAKSYGTKPKR